jgi:chromosomal replication initiator protein
MLETATISWDCIAAEVKQATGEEGFNRWMKNTRVVQCGGNGLVLAVPSLFMKNWFEGNFRATIAKACLSACGEELPVSFVVDARLNTAPAPADEKKTEPRVLPRLTPATLPRAVSAGPTLNRAFRFDNFISSRTNELALFAARKVAQAPGVAYNPLYFYGPPGVGKTHLLQAAAHEILSSGARIVYVTGEQFFHEYVRGLQLEKDKLKSFREKYFSPAVLIVDDVHKLATKKSTQYQFHQIFDKLMDRGRQVILSGRMLPREMDGLKEELIQRFTCGLVVRVDVPDAAGREQIVDAVIARARCGGSLIGRDVRRFVADNFPRSVRSLIGASTRLLAYQSLIRPGGHAEMMTVREARITLGDLLTSEKHKIDLDDIIDAVSRHFRITPEDIRKNTKKKKMALPRQVAMYLARKHTDHSLATVGGFFGGRNHSTVTFAKKKITNSLGNDPVITRSVNVLEEELFR